MSFIERIEAAKKSLKNRQEYNLQVLKECDVMGLFELINTKYLEGKGKIDKWGGVDAKYGGYAQNKIQDYFTNKIILSWQSKEILRYRNYPEQKPILGIYVLVYGNLGVAVGHFRYFTFKDEHGIQNEVIDGPKGEFLTASGQRVRKLSGIKAGLPKIIAKHFAIITSPSSEDYWQTRNDLHTDSSLPQSPRKTG